MKARLLTLIAAVGSAALVSMAVAATPGLPAEVQTALDRAKIPREAFVAVVQEVGGPSLGTSRARLAWQAEQAVNPASLTKLFTTFAGLELLGPAWTWTTPVWLQGPIRDGVLNGNLTIKGSGDPQLVQERLWLMFRRVQQLGVREIRGDIVLDRSAFVVPEQNPADFDGEPLKPYNVRADALQLNYKSVVLTFTPDAARGIALVGADPPLAGVKVDASVPLNTAPCEDWRGALKADFGDPARIRFGGPLALACGEKVWAVAYADPKSYNERALQGLWREMGGKLGGGVREATPSGITPGTPPSMAPGTPTGPAPSFEISSPPLAEIVRDINKYSNNVMAQQLFLTLALTQRGSGTPELAREVLHQWMDTRFGHAADAAVIDNGSGLSRDTRISADLFARLLQAAWASPVMPELMSSLPVSGIDGTLKRSRATLGRAHLKTGSLRDVNGIAGYVLANSGRRYVVVAIVNHANASAARPVLDALVQWAASDAAVTANAAAIGTDPAQNR